MPTVSWQCGVQGIKASPREPTLTIITNVTRELRQEEGATLGWAFLCQSAINKMTDRHTQMPN